MADTATSRNRLRKPESGQYDNAWATPLNEDGGSDRVDEALDGRANYTLSGAKVLASTNYETDEARMRFQDITGGTGGTVTIPSVEKSYIVRNASTGDAAFSAGGVAATVKSGNTEIVVTDGSASYLVRTLDYGSDLLKTTGTPSLSTHLTPKSYVDAAILTAQLSGGTLTLAPGMAAWLASGTSATLAAAVSDEVGTGSVVFSTGATLTTPTLVTPTLSDATLSNASLTSPTMTNPVVGTQTPGDNTTKGASTAFVTAAVAAAIAAIPPNNWTQIGSTINTTSGTTATFTSIPQTYSDLLVVFEGLSHNSGSNQSLVTALSPDGSTWTTGAGPSTAAVLTAAMTVYGSVFIPGYRFGGGIVVQEYSDAPSNNSLTTGGGTGNTLRYRISAGVQAIRVTLSGGAFDAGTLKLYGR